MHTGVLQLCVCWFGWFDNEFIRNPLLHLSRKSFHCKSSFTDVAYIEGMKLIVEADGVFMFSRINGKLWLGCDFYWRSSAGTIKL